jgi:hypothetical protein
MDPRANFADMHAIKLNCQRTLWHSTQRTEMTVNACSTVYQRRASKKRKIDFLCIDSAALTAVGSVHMKEIQMNRPSVLTTEKTETMQ